MRTHRPNRYVENEYLISVALNRRHLSEGQKAYLANEYRKVISEKAKKERGIKGAVETNKILYGKEPERLSDNVSDKRGEKDTRKIASEKFHVGEWKVRQAQEIDKQRKGKSGGHRAGRLQVPYPSPVSQ